MNKLTDKKKINALIFLCALAYFISYLSRLNYAAVMAEFIAESDLLKADAVKPITAISITYGLGQLVSGYLGDRIKPRHIITGGFILTTIMNFIMPFAAPNITLMTVTWAINGFAQAMMWPPLVKIMTTALDRKTYDRATVLVSYGSSSGNIAVYLIAPAFISLSAGWRSIFFFSSACAFALIFIWNIAMNRFEKAGIPQPELTGGKKQDKGTSGTSAVIRSLGFALPLIMLAIVAQGMIRDGVTSWMPTFIGETYNLGTSISILSGVILPIFSIISFEITSYVHHHWFKNELLCAGIIALLAASCSLLLSLLLGLNAIVAILLSALIVACMHGMNLILICMLPASFGRFGNVSMVSGLLNFCTYIGSAISTYGMGKISDLFGWDAVILSWIIIAAAATVCCFACVGKWKKFKEEA